MKIVEAIAVSALVFCAGCTTTKTITKTVAEERSGYTYIPLDPFPAKEVKINCPTPMNNQVRLVSTSEALPDNAVRMSVEEFDQKTGMRFSAGSIGQKGNIYRITIDYINSTTVQQEFWIKKTATIYQKDGKGAEEVMHPSLPAEGKYTIGSGRYEVVRRDPNDPNFKKYNIPIYVGIGLRVISVVTALEGKVDISGLGSIGAEAEAKHLSGSLVVQTLGINGESISAALPIQSELNRTTVQSSIVAISSIKTQLYSDKTFVTYIPQVAELISRHFVLPCFIGQTLPSTVLDC